MPKPASETPVEELDALIEELQAQEADVPVTADQLAKSLEAMRGVQELVKGKSADDDDDDDEDYEADQDEDKSDEDEGEEDDTADDTADVCPECGGDLPEDATECAECGTKVAKAMAEDDAFQDDAWSEDDQARLEKSFTEEMSEDETVGPIVDGNEVLQTVFKGISDRLDMIAMDVRAQLSKTEEVETTVKSLRRSLKEITKSLEGGTAPEDKISKSIERMQETLETMGSRPQQIGQRPGAYKILEKGGNPASPGDNDNQGPRISKSAATSILKKAMQEGRDIPGNAFTDLDSNLDPRIVLQRYTPEFMKA